MEAGEAGSGQFEDTCRTVSSTELAALPINVLWGEVLSVVKVYRVNIGALANTPLLFIPIERE
jgi:hypothetical protein